MFALTLLVARSTLVLSSFVPRDVSPEVLMIEAAIVTGSSEQSSACPTCAHPKTGLCYLQLNNAGRGDDALSAIGGINGI
jgi:hypothetical protein